MSLPTTTKKLPEAMRRLLQQRIAGKLELPMQSQTSAQVIAMCSSDSGDARDLSELIQRDPALAGHVLGVANSAACGAVEQIVSLQHAVSRLGISTIHEIAVAVSLKGKVFDVPGFATRIREIWIHSAASAVYAKEIALAQKLDAEGAFLCGLLHDVGKPLVMQNLSDLVREKTDQPVPRGIMELAMDEFHERVGAMLVSHWDFPGWMAEVVGCHDHYERAKDHREEAMVVNFASHLSQWATDEGAGEAEFDRTLPVLTDLGLGEERLAELLARRGQVLEIADAFL